jgi:predicted ATPase
MLVIATYRPELTPPWPNRSHMTPITLNRLERPEVEALVGHAVGGKTLPNEVLDHIVAKSAGVPLYVEELTKTIIGSGVLEDRGDAYVLNGALSRLNIPETLQDSLTARLDRSPHLREVAQLGSVLGREFAYAMISALMGIEEPRLQSGLGQLVVDELLYQRGRPPRSRYLFKHALIQDAAYQSLLKRTRQQYHQQVAKLLEERYPEVVSSQPELVAHHYTEANCPAQAIAYWLKAGAAAARQSANVEAVDQFGKGLELIPALADPRERDARELDLRMALGPALIATKAYGHPDVGRNYTRAWELCEPLGDDTRGFAALRGLQLHHFGRNDLTRSRHFAEDVLRVAERLGDAAHLTAAHAALGCVLYWTGEFDLAHRHCQLGIETMDLNAPRLPNWPGAHPALTGLLYMAISSWMVGYPDRATEQIEDAVNKAEALAHPLTSAQTLCYGALIPRFRHEPDAAKDYAARAVRVCAEEHIEYFRGVAECIHGWALCASGETEKGLAKIGHGVERIPPGLQMDVLVSQADARLACHDHEAALAAATAGLTTVETTWGSAFEAEFHRLRGEALLASAGTVSEAEAAIQQGLAVARRQNAKSWELRCATSLARLWRQQGRHDEARALLAPVYDWFTEGFGTAVLRTARALLDELAGAATVVRS